MAVRFEVMWIHASVAPHCQGAKGTLHVRRGRQQGGAASRGHDTGWLLLSAQLMRAAARLD